LHIIPQNSFNLQLRLTNSTVLRYHWLYSLIRLNQLLGLNSEFANYTSAERQLPHITLRDFADPDYFPIGVKHRYTRK
jgi:hypothetical protein